MHDAAMRAAQSCCQVRHEIGSNRYLSQTSSPRDCALRAALVSATEAQDEVERRLLLDVVVRERAAVLKLLAREDQALLVRRDALLVLDLKWKHREW